MTPLPSKTQKTGKSCRVLAQRYATLLDSNLKKIYLRAMIHPLEKNQCIRTENPVGYTERAILALLTFWENKQ